MRKLISAGLMLLLSAAAPAMANHYERDRGTDDWRHRLERRIEHGWHSGELTRHEYRRLRWALRDVERAERMYWSDGYLSPRERSELHARLEWLAREIYREKHDFDRRHETYNYGHYDRHAHGRD